METEIRHRMPKRQADGRHRDVGSRLTGCRSAFLRCGVLIQQPAIPAFFLAPSFMPARCGCGMPLQAVAADRLAAGSLSMRFGNALCCAAPGCGAPDALPHRGSIRHRRRRLRVVSPASRLASGLRDNAAGHRVSESGTQHATHRLAPDDSRHRELESPCAGSTLRPAAPAFHRRQSSNSSSSSTSSTISSTASRISSSTRFCVPASAGSAPCRSRSNTASSSRV
ncbi:MAG: hypothetical protein KatS3mg004_0383 [Bryobacteraceae bacterium]|nr:MAG: hypothetical protein KatS3mg004_0383 [Bryobacteraceae bacterium]